MCCVTSVKTDSPPKTQNIQAFPWKWNEKKPLLPLSLKFERFEVNTGAWLWFFVGDMHVTCHRPISCVCFDRRALRTKPLKNCRRRSCLCCLVSRWSRTRSICSLVSCWSCACHDSAFWFFSCMFLRQAGSSYDIPKKLQEVFGSLRAADEIIDEGHIIGKVTITDDVFAQSLLLRPSVRLAFCRRRHALWQVGRMHVVLSQCGVVCPVRYVSQQSLMFVCFS